MTGQWRPSLSPREAGRRRSGDQSCGNDPRTNESGGHRPKGTSDNHRRTKTRPTDTIELPDSAGPAGNAGFSDSAGLADGASPADRGDLPASSGPAEQAMVLSAERMKISTTTEPSRRLRVAKRIVTETRTITVSHEELVIEEPPVDAATGGVSRVILPVEFVLSEERVTVTAPVTTI